MNKYTVGVIDGDGNVIRLFMESIIEHVIEAPKCKQEDIYASFKDPMEICVELDAVRIHNGMMDYITGHDTPAARRYARTLKRNKEKGRRNRLKYGKREA